MNTFRLHRLTLAVAAALPLIAVAAEPVGAYTLDEIVVTAPRMSQPLTIVTDPKKPQQPVPANDGASYLKNIPGFAVTRKGGTDGDPVLRGLAGSRLNILLDGMDFHGGCGMRMDPPTAYVFPETYDQVTVIKGPQTVAYGNGNSAGVVLFDRDRNAVEPGNRVSGSVMGGSWGRADVMVHGKSVTDKASFEATLTHAESGDYADGAGVKVHSAYERQSVSVQAGYRPDSNVYAGIDYTVSKAEAAYADRGMDGVKFDRDSVGLTLERRNVSPLLGKVSARVYHTYIDHVMDNYSFRPLVDGIDGGTEITDADKAVSNPDRDTSGARVSADLNVAAQTTLKLGADWRDDAHTLRTTTNYLNLARDKDYASTMTGVFGELTHTLANDRRVIAGLRHDAWDAERFIAGVSAATATQNLMAGFARYEQDLTGQPATVFVGMGHNERPMDYWEAVNKIGLSATSNLNPEKTDQLDAGLLWKTDTIKGSLSAYYAKVGDYILTRTNGTAWCANLNGCAENVDATRYGAEADLAYKLNNQMTVRGSLAYVHADNDTHNTALAQTPPLEGRVGLDYKAGAWSYGGVVRAVASQDRVHVGYGTIVGQDQGATAGFATLALNASYKPNKKSLVSVGVDNVFDKTYFEHISRADAAVTGYTTDTTTRLNEPGRFLWLKATLATD
jgi:iron complex outermembrane recepter protein